MSSGGKGQREMLLNRCMGESKGAGGMTVTYLSDGETSDWQCRTKKTDATDLTIFNSPRLSLSQNPSLGFGLSTFAWRLALARNHRRRGSPCFTKAMVVPEPNTWSEIIGRVPALPRPLKVAMPCVGIDGCGTALKQLGVPFQGCHVFDLDTRYLEYLQQHLPDAMNLRVGPVDGDLLKKDICSLSGGIDLLVSGPPCPPWAGNGKHNGTQDPRADVFGMVLTWMVRSIKEGCLVASLIENVKGTMQRSGGEEAFMKKVLRVLTNEVTEFAWEITVLNAQDYMLAQSRTRVFLRGMRKTFMSGPRLPPVLSPLGTRPLKDFLDPDAPATSRGDLTSHMHQNLKDMHIKVKADLQAGILEGCDVVAFPLDRAQGKAYKQRYRPDICPTLTCNNKYLYVMSVRDMEKPDEEKEFARFLLPKERLVLQGFPADVYDKLPTETTVVKAAGNAYPVPLLMACLKPIVEEISTTNDDMMAQPPSQELVVDAVHNIVHKILKPTKVQVLKRPAAANDAAGPAKLEGPARKQALLQALKPKEVGKLEKPRAKGVLKRPAAKTPVKRPAAANVQTHKRATPTRRRLDPIVQEARPHPPTKIVAIRRGKRVLVNKNHFFSSSDDE